MALGAGTHRPSGALALIGACFGEMIRRAHPSHIRWAEAPAAVGGDYPTLEMISSHNEQVSYAFPVDRVCRCYQEGSDRDLRTYYDVVIADVLQHGDMLGDRATFDEVAGRIYPVLKPAGWSESMPIACMPFTPGGPLGTPVIVAVVDHPTRISFLLQDSLDKWSVGFPRVVARACANLASETPSLEDHLVELDISGAIPVLWLAYEDYFNASRALLTEALYRAAKVRLPDAERFLMAVPNRDVLLITAEAGRHEFHVFQGLVRWFHERQPAPISSICFVLGIDGIVGFEQGEAYLE